jgi:FtsH-binding integral membrane protein
MTIMGYIRGRVWKIGVIALLPFLLLQLAATFTRAGLFALYSDILAWITMLYFLGAVMWTALAIRRIPCPRCSKPLGSAATAVGMNLKRAKQCPNCGVSLDESMP